MAEADRMLGTLPAPGAGQSCAPPVAGPRQAVDSSGRAGRRDGFGADLGRLPPQDSGPQRPSPGRPVADVGRRVRRTRSFKAISSSSSAAIRREKTEHMLDTLGIELGREREAYFSDLEYAAALLDTRPEAIDDIAGSRVRANWPTGIAPKPTCTSEARQSRLSLLGTGTDRRLAGWLGGAGVWCDRGGRAGDSIVGFAEAGVPAAQHGSGCRAADCRSQIGSAAAALHRASADPRPADDIDAAIVRRPLVRGRRR